MESILIKAVMPTYARYDLTLERGQGVYVFDNTGKQYLDFGSGIAVNSLGHCHPHLVKTLKTQAEIFWHCSNLYNIPSQNLLAQRLVENSFADSVFFNNSGAEAVELSVKVARKYQSETGNAERYRVITIEGAFHGRSLAMLAAGRQVKHIQGFGPIVDGFDQVKFGDLTDMRQAIKPETAAIMVEPIQGEGGIRALDAAYIRGIRELADEFGLLLIVDEVQSGMGRTGKLFAYQNTGIKPDIMALAKGLGGGFPIGACLAKEKIAIQMGAGSHGSTFGGNPMATAVGNAVLDIILEKGFLKNVGELSAIFCRKLQNLIDQQPKFFTELRGAGLMLGLQCSENIENGTIVERLLHNGLLTVPAADNVIRLIPPLIIKKEHIEEASSILETTCNSF